MEDTELKHRFTHHAPKADKNQAERYTALRDHAYELARHINLECPESREKSLAITHLEETIFWANASIARNE